MAIRILAGLLIVGIAVAGGAIADEPENKGSSGISVLPDDFVLTPEHNAAETAVVVLPAKGDDPTRVFVSTANTQSVHRLTLPPDGPPTDFEDLSPHLPKLADKDELGFDNVSVRTKDGALLVMRACVTWEPVDPKPEWWDYNDGKRGTLYVWRTDDRGKTWNVTGIDSAKVLDGKCAWPQEFSSKDAEGNEKITKWFGGWDRPEIYADPFSGNVYITTSINAGNAPAYSDEHAFYHMALFVSTDGGRTWDRDPIVWDGQYNSSYRPLVMTATPSGRLYLIHASWPYEEGVGHRPILYWVDPPWDKIAGSVEVWYGDAGAKGCGSVASKDLVGKVFQPGVLAPALARAKCTDTEDAIRVTYMAVDPSGREVQRVLNVTVTRDGEATVRPITTFEASDPLGSVLQANFIESDPIETGQDPNVAMLYWFETSPSRGQFCARGAIVRGESDWSDPFDLSVEGGRRRYWTHHGAWVGDYMKGGFFMRDGRCVFIPGWPESDPEHIPLHGNIVTVAP